RPRADARTEVARPPAKISAAYLERLLEQKDVARFSEGLRQVVPTLTPATKKDLLQKMADPLASPRPQCVPALLPGPSPGRSHPHARDEEGSPPEDGRPARGSPQDRARQP